MKVGTGASTTAGRRHRHAGIDRRGAVQRDRLPAAAERCHGRLIRHGAAEKDISVHWVPGSFELPFVAQEVAVSGAADAIVCLGAVIRVRPPTTTGRGRCRPGSRPGVAGASSALRVRRAHHRDAGAGHGAGGRQARQTRCRRGPRGRRGRAAGEADTRATRGAPGASRQLGLTVRAAQVAERATRGDPWQPHREGGSLALHRGGGDVAAQPADQLPAEVEAQARAADPLVAVVTIRPKRVKRRPMSEARSQTWSLMSTETCRPARRNRIPISPPSGEYLIALSTILEKTRSS